MRTLTRLSIFLVLAINWACSSPRHFDPPASSPAALPTVSDPTPTQVPSLAAPSSTPVTLTLSLPPTLTPSPTVPPVTTLLFTGVIVPARCVQSAIDARGDAEYVYDEVRATIQAADFAIGTFNATMSDVPPHTGCIPTYVLVGSPANADALANAGFDAMSVATNHIKDCGLTTCGDKAFFDTLEALRRVGIQPVGAGSNQSEALQPIVLIANGVRFAIISLGQIQQGGVYATAEKPGIAELTLENLQNSIVAARQISDVVIVMPHWGPEDVATPTWIQRNLAHQIVEAGADLVVGNHTHVVQGFQEINGIPVFYGLGNFVFDQWEREHQQGVILKIMYSGTQYLGYELIPTRTEKNGLVHIAGPEEAAEIIERIRQASAGLK